MLQMLLVEQHLKLLEIKLHQNNVQYCTYNDIAKFVDNLYRIILIE